MKRGFFSGTVWGLIVGVVAIVAATQFTERQELSLPQPERAETTVPDATEFAEVRDESDPVAPTAEDPVLGDDLAAATPDQPRAESDAVPSLDSAPIAAPVPESDAPDALPSPDEPDAPAVVSAPDTTRPGQDQIAAPAAPASDKPLASGIEAPTAPLPVPVPVEEAVAAVVLDTETDTLPIVPEAEPDTPPVVPEAVQPAPEAEIAEAPQVPEAPEAPQTDDTQLAIAAVPETAVEEPRRPTTPETTEAAVLPDDSANTQIDAGNAQDAMPGKRAGTLPGVIRLNEETEEPRTEIATLDPADAAGAALDSFRVAYERPADVPLLSLILIVPEASAVLPDTLAALPFKVSFAIFARDPEASQTASDLRKSGAEILMIPSLPQAATPADVEQALQANLSVIPQAVAFLDAPEASFQTDRTAVAQVVAAAGASGHGLVTFPRGLNTAQKIAERDGVPAGLVFRDLDADGQDSATIRRTLDQAAFRARQEGEVILVGRARPQTITALTEWALGNRAASVSLAPVSAVIAPQG
jgi:hypothetical protein